MNAAATGGVAPALRRPLSRSRLHSRHPIHDQEPPHEQANPHRRALPHHRYIDTAADGKQTARDARYHVVGYYDPHTDTTRDARHHLVGHGNLLATLIGRG